MNSKYTINSLMLGITLLFSMLSQAKILAMVNYESKPKETTRREGIAIIDVDPEFKNFTLAR